MRRTLAALALAALLAGCQSTSSVMQTWVGDTESNLMAKWGAPDRQASPAGGGHVLTYNGHNGYGGTICQKTFISNASGTIVSTSNNCPI